VAILPEVRQASSNQVSRVLAHLFHRFDTRIAPQAVYTDEYKVGAKHAARNVRRTAQPPLSIKPGIREE